MPAFQYQALDKSGKTVSGIWEADNSKQARQELRNQQLTILNITSAHGQNKKPGTVPWWQQIGKSLSIQDVALLTRQLATLIGAGVPLEEAINSVAEQAEKANVKTIMLGVRAKVLEGFSLANALAEYPRIFSPLYCATVGAGEKTGRLEIVLERLADYVERQQQVRQKVIQAAIYPSLILLASLGIVSFLLSFVVPKMIGVFVQGGQALPPLTALLITMSNAIKHYGLYVFIVLVIAIILFKRSLRKTAMRYRWHKFLLRLPMIGKTIRFINTARFAHTFAMLNQAGIEVLEAMRVGSETVTNVIIRDSLLEATRQVREGVPISKALQKTRFFPPLSLQLISSGENSGQLSKMLERAALAQENTVQAQINLLLTLFEPVVILIMGGVVLFIVLAVLLPIFSLDQMVS